MKSPALGTGGQLRKSTELWRCRALGAKWHPITRRLMATVADTVTGPRSQPADVPPVVALKRKLSAVSWPFRALGTEGARELLPGPLPTLLTRCKQGPGLGEEQLERRSPPPQTEIRGEEGDAGSLCPKLRWLRRHGLINEEKSTRMRPFQEYFLGWEFSPDLEFPLEPPPPPTAHMCTPGGGGAASEQMSILRHQLLII